MMSNTDPDTNRSIQTVLDDPSMSFWIKRALNELLARDPLDALRDAQLLVDMMQVRLSNTEGEHSHGGEPTKAGSVTSVAHG